MTMNPSSSLLKQGTVLALLGLTCVSQLCAQPAPVAGKYIVLLQPGASPVAVAARHGLAPDHVYQTAVNGFSGAVPPGKLRLLRNDPRVAAVVQDYTVQAICRPGGGGGTIGQVVPAGVSHIGAAPGMLTFNGLGVGVAGVDTGVDLPHADLDATSAFSAYGGTAQDDNGHGTHVSGIIAAKDNTIDVVGVAPKAKIFAVKVLDASGSGADSDVIAGLDYVAANAATSVPPIRVVNMSLGRPASSNDSAMHSAVQAVVDAGVTVVVAGGNDCGSEISQQVPAGFAEVIAVASTTAKDGTKNRAGYLIPADTASYFTTDGEGVVVSAPGEDQENVSNGYFLSSVGILSTRLGGGTTRMSGTSMASPHVAGVVALLYEKAGGVLAPETVRTKIMNGASNLYTSPLDSPTSGYTFDGDREGILSA